MGVGGLAPSSAQCWGVTSDTTRSVPDISDRMLAERLRELEAEGVVDRHVFPTTPVRIEYELTAKGRALEAAIVAIEQWANKWIEPAAVVAGSSGR